jgi:hypothetical protein
MIHFVNFTPPVFLPKILSLPPSCLSYCNVLFPAGARLLSSPAAAVVQTRGDSSSDSRTPPPFPTTKPSGKKLTLRGRLPPKGGAAVWALARAITQLHLGRLHSPMWQGAARPLGGRPCHHSSGRWSSKPHQSLVRKDRHHSLVIYNDRVTDNVTVLGSGAFFTPI